MSYLRPPMAGRFSDLLQVIPRRGDVHVQVRVHRRAVRAGDAVAATVVLFAEGRGGRIRDLTLRLERIDWDGPHTVATTGEPMTFEVRSAVEVTYPVAVPIAAEAVPSGTRSRYVLVAEGRVGFRDLRTETAVVVLPAPDEGSGEIFRRGAA